MPGTPTLKLAYDFEPSPFPILVSDTGGNPSTIDLRVVISNPGSNTVTVGSIAIEIPVGEDVSRDLAVTPTLPSPTYDTSIPWTISIDTSSTDTINIVPSPGPTGTVGAPIVFTLPGISVNHVSGKVPITVTEYTTAKVIDPSTYNLHKQPVGFPVTSFYAEPATLDDLDRTTTLHWTCTDLGAQYTYSLRIVETESAPRLAARATRRPASLGAANADAAFKDCIGDGDCYTVGDGKDGVETPSLDQTTTFALDAIKTESTGERSVIGTLETTVQVAVPWISQNSYLRSSPTGRFVALHWLAANARRCTVQMDGVSIDDDAPADTYQDGYVVVPSGDPRPHTFAVIAHTTAGPATASLEFLPYAVGAPATIPVGNFPVSIAFTPDSTLALIGTIDDKIVAIVDVATLSVLTTIPIGDWVGSIAVTPDGTLAVGVAQYGDHATVIDLATRTPVRTIPAGPRVAVAITPDGTLAVAAGRKVPDVVVIDIASGTVVASVPIDSEPQAMAMTPDGALVFTVNQDDSTVSVVDVAARTIKTTITGVGQRLGDIAVTPDGAVVLVTDLLGSAVSVIDVKTCTNRGTQIPVGTLPYRIAVTPDGAHALVPCARSDSVFIIDLSTYEVVGTAPTGTYPAAIAILPNSTCAVVTCDLGNTASIIDIPARTSETIPVGDGPVVVAAAPDGSLVLVGNRQDNNLTAL